MTGGPDVAVYSQALVQQLVAAHAVGSRRPYDEARSALRAHLQRRGDAPDEVARLARAGDVDGEVARWLTRAQPVYFGGEPLTLLRASWQALPDWTLRAEDVGAPAGYIWFAEPVLLDAERSERPQALALLWFPSPGADGRPGVFLVPFLTWEAPADGGRPFPGGRPNFPTLWRIGASLTEWDDAHGGHGGAPAEDNPTREAFGRVRRLFASCVALLNQTIVRTETRPADRATRRRAQAELGLGSDAPAPLIRVVLLRRLEPPPGSAADRDGGDAPAWRWRWTVRAHWRRQYYPATGEHRPILIATHVKGPPDRPLKASTPIWAMTR